MPSYLLKNRNGNYYTRITFPQALRTLGCPAEVRVSLRTKEYAVAGMRNLLAAHGVKLLLAKLASLAARSGREHPSDGLRALLAPELTALRQQIARSERAAPRFGDETDGLGCENLPEPSLPGLDTPVVSSAAPEPLPVEPAHQASPAPDLAKLGPLQAEFIARKAQDGISLRSVQQLQTRTSVLVEMLGADFPVSDLKFRQVDAFILHLANKGLKEKTIREYKAACSQMLDFAVKHEFASKNPFEQVKVKHSKATPRCRWTRPQLKTLFTTMSFTQPNRKDHPDDYWIPLVLLHTGARPSEICQLRTKDVVTIDGISCLKITDEGDGQTVKTTNAIRAVPIHSKLLELGFLAFVRQRRRQGSGQLFECKPTGKFGEWSKNFERRFDRRLSQLGFAAGQRPTAYSFRHTIIDELKQQNVPEHVTADLAGQSRKGITYGHYGKVTPIEQLKSVIEQLDFSEELASVRRLPSLS